jgi:hypothetical protein
MTFKLNNIDLRLSHDNPTLSETKIKPMHLKINHRNLRHNHENPTLS